MTGSACLTRPAFWRSPSRAATALRNLSKQPHTPSLKKGTRVTPAFAQDTTTGVDFTVELWIPLVLVAIGLIVALIQYRREKEIDRQLEIRKEKRAAFTGFVRALDRLINHRVFADTDEETSAEIIKAKEALNECYLRASSDNLKLFVAAIEAARQLSNSLEKPDTESEEFQRLCDAYNTALTEAVNGARQEFGPSANIVDPLTEGMVDALILLPDKKLERAVEIDTPKALDMP